jgi:hypothetical protein
LLYSVIEHLDRGGKDINLMVYYLRWDLYWYFQYSFRHCDPLAALPMDVHTEFFNVSSVGRPETPIISHNFPYLAVAKVRGSDRHPAIISRHHQKLWQIIAHVQRPPKIIMNYKNNEVQLVSMLYATTSR